MERSRAHKQHAIDLHTAQAGEFEARYRALLEDPYRSTFTYGRMKIERLIERTLREVPRPARALDAGCGTGFSLGKLHELGFEVVGMEPAEGMRLVARRDHPDVDIRDGDIEQLPFADRAFDVVLCLEVIRYLEDPRRALAEIARVLRPGGTAIVTAAPRWSLNGYGLINLVTSRWRVPGFTKVRHSFMTERTARRVMLEAGFDGVAVHGVFLGPWQALGRLAPGALAATLRLCEAFDDRLSDLPPLRDLCNHLVMVGRR